MRTLLKAGRRVGQVCAAIVAFAGGYWIHLLTSAAITYTDPKDLLGDHCALERLLDRDDGFRRHSERVVQECGSAEQILHEGRGISGNELVLVAWENIPTDKSGLREALGNEEDSDWVLKSFRTSRSGRQPTVEVRLGFRAWLESARQCVRGVRTYRRQRCRETVGQAVRLGTLSPLVPGTSAKTRAALEAFTGLESGAAYPETRLLVGRSFYEDGESILEWIVDGGRLYGVTRAQMPELGAMYIWESHILETLVGQAVNWLMSENIISIADAHALLR